MKIKEGKFWRTKEKSDTNSEIMDDVLDLSNNNMYELKLRMVYE